MNDTAPVRLLVVDDHNLFRRGLIALLSRDARVSVVAEARDAGEALKMAQLHQPDVILLDNHLPGVHGVEALPQLASAAPQARTVMLTVSEDADDLAQALTRGAVGYLLKTVEGDELVSAILRVRAAIIRAMRGWMDRNGFLLVDAPILTPAACRVLPQHEHLHRRFALVRPVLEGDLFAVAPPHAFRFPDP